MRPESLLHTENAISQVSSRWDALKGVFSHKHIQYMQTCLLLSSDVFRGHMMNYDNEI